MPERIVAGKAAPAMVRIGATAKIPELLSDLGADPRAVLSAAGFDAALFDNPDNVLTYTARSRLLTHCAEMTGCPHFGLLIGQHNHLHSLGLIGLLVKFSPNVEIALRALEHYIYLHVGGAGVMLEIDGGTAVLSYQAYESGAEGDDQVGAGAVSTMFNVMRELCGPDWKPVEAWFMHRIPDHVEPFRQFLRVRLRFNAEKYAIVFSSSWLRRPLAEANPEVRKLIQNQIDALASTTHDHDFLAQVRFVLRAALASGQASEERVATLFSMHPRTFTRRLKEHGVGFRELADEIRYEIARQLLSASDRQINDIAEILHYADARSFIRAFRRWSGTTPARWRIAHRQQAADHVPV